MTAGNEIPPVAGQPASTGRFRVLLGTFDGAGYLDQQLASIAMQDARAIDLLVSDDGSHDGTRGIVSAWAERWEKGSILQMDGPKRGFAENYRALVLATDPEAADWFAFCDQDDIWLPGKLDAARTALESLPGDAPRLYCSRTSLVTEDGRPAGLSPLMEKAPSFENALVQSIAGGNTMVMDRRTFRIFREACGRTGFVSHDWWAYLVVAGAGGHVLYDPEPHIFYRQHPSNAVGANNSASARMARVSLLIKGRFRGWTSRNLDSLMAISDLLSPENRETAERFSAVRKQGRLAFLQFLRARGIRRQSTAGTISLFAGALLGKI